MPEHIYTLRVDWQVSIQFKHDSGHGLSAFTTAIRLHKALEEQGNRLEAQAADPDESDDEGKQMRLINQRLRRQFVSRVLALFSGQNLQQGCSRVFIHDGVVDRWDKILHHEASHDVVIETADGSCSANAAVLRQASNALSAALSWPRDGRGITLNLKDSHGAAVKLFLELIYSGSTSIDVDADVAIEALELAHRWQVDDVTVMVGRLLEGLLTEATVEAIADAAQRMQIQHLQQVCRVFAYRSGLRDEVPPPKKRRTL